MAKEEILLRLNLLQQEAEKLQEQIQIINQQIFEFESLKLSLDKIDKTEEKEILAGLGRGIFFKSELKDKGLFVNVGCDVVLKKSPEEACDIIQKQIFQLENIKNKLLEEMEKINFQLQSLMEEARKEG